jgi:glycerol-3-phosphate dehydrogenase (NAD+)
VRQGLHEIGEFCKLFYATYESNTLLESCGIADLVATCHGGRNRRVSEEFAKRIQKSSHAEEKEIPENNLKAIWTQVEKDVLNGQKMQGLGITIIAFVIIIFNITIRNSCRSYFMLRCIST